MDSYMLFDSIQFMDWEVVGEETTHELTNGKGKTKMSNSALVKHTNISPNKTSPRNNSIQKITIHHMAGNLSVESCGQVFQNSVQGPVATTGLEQMVVLECMLKNLIDRGAAIVPVMTIRRLQLKLLTVLLEDWPVSDTAYSAMIDLVVDICWRNGISSLSWTGDSSGTLTIHKFFSPYGLPRTVS